jgi:SAM-dependent methyltransferase
MLVCPSCGDPFEGPVWCCPSCGHRPPDRGGYRVALPESEVRASEGEAMFDPAAFSELAAAEASCFWFQRRNGLITWALRRYFPEARSFLEVGCGTGYVLGGLREAFPELRLAGGEYYSPGLPFARSRLPGVELDQLDARRLPFEQEFDVVGAFDVIEHISEDQEALAQLRRAVRPGGGVLVTVPQHPRLWSPADDYGEHKRRYRRRELVEKVRAAGLEVERVTSFVSLLLPAMIASRFLDRRRAEDYDPTAELKTGPALNRAMGGVLAAECALIRAGVSFPVGGSLLVVARRP